MSIGQPNYISRFYANQSRLRGITSVEDIEAAEALQSGGYNRLVYKHLEAYKKRKVVEIACGPGIFMRYLHKRGFVEVMGIEMSDCYADICISQGFKVIKADALKWLESQPNSSIDVIVAIDFIEHIDKQTFINFLDAVHSVLSPNGLFIARCPCGDSPFFGLNFYNDITHETVFTSTALRVLISLCNMEIIEFVDDYPSNIIDSRWWRVPLSHISRKFMQKIIYWSTGQYIKNLSPDMWIVAKPK